LAGVWVNCRSDAALAFGLSGLPPNTRFRRPGGEHTLDLVHRHSAVEHVLLEPDFLFGLTGAELSTADGSHMLLRIAVAAISIPPTTEKKQSAPRRSFVRAFQTWLTPWRAEYRAGVENTRIRDIRSPMSAFYENRHRADFMLGILLPCGRGSLEDHHYQAELHETSRVFD